MKVTNESDNDHARVKLEIDESAGELDVAREKFESALQDLLFREEVSDSDSEEQQQQQQQLQQQQQQQQDAVQVIAQQQPSTPSGGATTTSSRPPRKRRRKDAETTQQSSSGTSQQSSFVVRMFDRSVDLAQFSSDSPLYPICRAWLLNEPHHASGGSELHLSPPSPTPLSPAVDLPEVHFLPTPAPWSNEVRQGQPSPLLPRPITPPPLIRSEGAVGPVGGYELLGHHVKHWRAVRQSWKKRAALADARYEDSAEILKEMFRTHAAAAADNASQFA